MSVNYDIIAIDDRLLGVVTAIDSGGGPGMIKLLAGATIVSTIQLSQPCGIVNVGVLTFTGTLLDPSAGNTGFVDSAIVQDSTGVTHVSGLTVGIPLSGRDVIISNGLNNTLITAGQVVSLLSAQITGS